jgi:hypothetical protein
MDRIFRPQIGNTPLLERVGGTGGDDVGFGAAM